MVSLHLPGRSYALEGIGLDVDGVMRDSGYLAYDATRKTITDFGGVAPTFEEYVRDFHYDFLSYYRACGATLTREQLEERFWIHCKSPEAQPPYPDVVDFLAQARRQGLKVFTVSAHPAEKVHGWFAEHVIDDHFLHLAGGSRNKVACIRNSCAELGIGLEGACYVGDWGIDMVAAREASTLAIGITRGYSTRDVLFSKGAVHVVDHLYQLAELIY